MDLVTLSISSGSFKAKIENKNNVTDICPTFDGFYL